MGEARLHQLLALQFEYLDALAEALNVLVRLVFEVPAQQAQRFDDLGADRAARSLGRRQRTAVERVSSRDAEPQCKQHQIDVEAVAILQREQRRRYAGERIEGERKPPERLFGGGFGVSHRRGRSASRTNVASQPSAE